MCWECITKCEQIEPENDEGGGGGVHVSMILTDTPYF